MEWYDGSTTYSGHSRPAIANLELHNHPSGWLPYEGEQYAELDSDWDGPSGSLTGEPASIRMYQDINTCPGEKYTLQYAWSPRPNTSDNQLEVYWDGALVASHSAAGSSNTVWTLDTLSDLEGSAGATTRLEFIEVGNPDSYGMFLDAVALSAEFELTIDDLDFDCDGACCEASIIIHDGDTDYTIAEFNAANLGAGSYSYTVECGCPDSPCGPTTSDPVDLTIVAPCPPPTAPDFSICIGTTIDDDLFTVNGVQCNGDECCVITDIDYTGASSDQEGTFDYTVYCACPDSPCPPAEATGTVTVVDCIASLTLVKTGTLDDTVVAPAGVPNVGDRIDYTFEVENTGNVTLTNVTVADTIGGVTISGGPLASLAVGDTDSSTFTGYYYITQDDIDAGHFFNTATADSDESEPDSDDEDVPLPQSPALTLVKTGTLDDTVVAPAGVPNVGDRIDYTFEVENTGNVTLTNVTVADTIGGVTISGGPLASLAVGDTDSSTFTGYYYITQDDIDAGHFFNTATADSDESEPDSDDEDVPLPQSPALTLVKTGTLDDTVVAPAGVPNVGDRIDYTFEVENTGNVTLTNVTVADTIGGVTISGGPLASLAVGDTDSSTFTGYYYITQDDIDAGHFFNTATADSDESEPDSDDEDVPLPQSPALTLVKTGTLDDTVVAPAGVPNVGDRIDYTFEVENTGNVTLTNVTVEDTVGGVTISGGPLASLAVGATDSTTFTGYYYITQDDIDAGHFFNTATADSDESEPDSDDEDVPLPQSPALTLVKTGTLDDTVVDPDGVPNVGDRIDYTFAVENTGNVTLTNVTVEDTVGGVTISGGPLASLAVGATDSTTFTGYYYITQDDIDAGHFFNTATADSDESEPDSDDEDVLLPQFPAISISKSADATSADPGDTITYTISYENTGQVTLTGVVIIDDYDQTYVASVTNISDGGEDDGDVITWEGTDIGDLAPGQSGSVSYDVTLNGTGSFDEGTTPVDNVVVVTTDQTDPEEDNDIVTVTISTPSRGGSNTQLAGEPTCFFDVDMMGDITRVYYTCPDGHCLGNYEPEDPSQQNFLELKHMTKVDYELNGQISNSPPRWIRMRVSQNPPPTAPGQVAVTEVYDFLGYTPTGVLVDSVIFGQPIGMQLDYDPDALPDNTTGVGIAAWDEASGTWQLLAQATGRVAGVGSATADVTHFSTFVVLATIGDATGDVPTPESTPTVTPSSRPASFTGEDLRVMPAVEELWAPLTFVTKTGNTVTITADIKNEGDDAGTYTADLVLNGTVVGSQDVSLLGGEKKQVRFVVSRLGEGDYTVQLAGMSGSFTATQQVTWWLIAIVFGILAIAVGWFLRRRIQSNQPDTQEGS